MEAFLLDWLNLLVRWLHVITGIAWIGSSLYFVWLDNHLHAPKLTDDVDKGVGGELWSVHGGGFYHAQKYAVAPKQLPETLHWFKWEAYSTWLSGMFLLILIYWFGADVYLIDPSVQVLSQSQAVLLAAGFLVGTWVIYEGLCRSPIGKHDTALSIAVLVLVGMLAWGLCQVFGGRGAYLHFGAVLGTLMVANVFVIIIPGQKEMVAAAGRGEIPDPTPGIRGKQRSVHNTYFTLPVVFAMISNHYAMTYGHTWNWVILLLITLGGALVRVFFVARHKGNASPTTLILGLVCLAAAAGLSAPTTNAIVDAQPVPDEQLKMVVDARCKTCHSSTPTQPGFVAAPAGIVFDSMAQIENEAHRIYQQTVTTRVMPIGNLTGMTDDERQLIDAWYQQLEAQHE